jgi:hypothetical protein
MRKPHQPQPSVDPSIMDDDDSPMSKVRARTQRMSDEQVEDLAASVKRGELQLEKADIAKRVRQQELTPDQGVTLAIATSYAWAARMGMPPDRLAQLESLLRVMADTEPLLLKLTGRE